MSFKSMSTDEAREIAKSRQIAREKKIQGELKNVIKEVPAKFYSLALKVYSGEASSRQAIKLKCAECCGYEDVKIRVSECTIERCPLHFFRPYQSS